jgi:hypothetical protein
MIPLNCLTTSLYCTFVNNLINLTFVAPVPNPVVEEGTLRPIPPNPCTPSPCGPNSQCQVVSGQAQCGCVSGMIGSVPNCRPECVLSSDCASNRACINQKCVDPCPGTCASNTDCRVVNHSPVCNCATGYTGDGFSNCRPIPAVGKKLHLFEFPVLSAFACKIACLRLQLFLIIIATFTLRFLKTSHYFKLQLSRGFFSCYLERYNN